MIAKWKVFNFKSIKSETELDLAPLTIFAGANSSGKSSFIQSLLLVAQTLSHKVETRAVVLNGSLVRLGQFDDLKSNGGQSDKIMINCTCLSDKEEKHMRRYWFLPRAIAEASDNADKAEIAVEFSFDAGTSANKNDQFQIQPQLNSSRLSFRSFGDQSESEENRYLYFESGKNRQNKELSMASEDADHSETTETQDIVELDAKSLEEIKEDQMSAQLHGCVFEHFIPDEIVCEFDRAREIARTTAQLLKDGRLPRRRSLFYREYDISLSDVVPVLQTILQENDEFDKTDANVDSLLADPDDKTSSFLDRWQNLADDETSRYQKVFQGFEDLERQLYEKISELDIESKNELDYVGLPSYLTISSRYLKRQFSSLFKYLGPLREAPKSLYPLTPSASLDDIGVQGENAAAILELHKNQRISYIPAKAFSTSKVNTARTRGTLESAVIDWLRHLDVATGVLSRDRGKFGHELQVKLSGSKDMHDLTHVGVGVSQVLPILVMCLLAKPHSILVLEQPELHLHPKVQSLLGDFFLSMILCRKQCIIETHSEYLIDRLRYRIAADPVGATKFEEKMKIYFVEKSAKGASKFSEVVVNEYGAISNWPDGFFDQSPRQAEEILRAAHRKQQAKSSGDE